jgi:hypothetical protein
MIMKNSKLKFRSAPAIVCYTMLAVVFKPFKRLIGLILFLFGALVCGLTVFPFLFLFFGIEKANSWMDNNILPLVGWWV